MLRGRFFLEICLPVPDASARSKILQLALKHTSMAPQIDWTALGRATAGFVGSDLMDMVGEAGVHAVSRISAASFPVAAAEGGQPFLPAAGAADNSKEENTNMDQSACQNYNSNFYICAVDMCSLMWII